ncbi:fimbrial protein [Serratia marcescens]|uniref:fimbrial protein n=1 Tax=Serratia marcescens TaxID=615 RepID=UPI003983551C
MNRRLRRVKNFFLFMGGLGVAGSAISAIPLHGKINMRGGINDAACTIATESREQVFDMGVASFSDVYLSAHGKSIPFTIRLVNCNLEWESNSLSEWRWFQVNFDGNVDGEMFGVSGEASGVALVISDADGNVARPGIPLPLSNNSFKNDRLNYFMKLMANRQPFKSGEYFTSVRFKMDYY